MTEHDIVLLTDSRYVKPRITNSYVQNIIDEDILLTNALQARGLRTVRVDWADKNFDWETAKTAVFRTTWDYFDRIGEFLQWLNDTSKKIQFINPIDTILWNLDKHYLQDLADHQVNIPPTLFIEQGEPSNLQEIISKTDWQDIILKPTVSGAARHTYRISLSNLADHEIMFKRLINQESMLLQPFQHSVLKMGEIALMYFNGEYSHAILKKAKPGDFRVQDDFGGTVHDYNPSRTEIELGYQALAVCSPLPVYARVDIITNNAGNPVVSELELIEPELWLRCKPAAAELFADGIKTYLQQQLIS